MAELLGLGAVAEAQRLGEAGAAGRGADGAVQARRAQAVKETAIHAGVVEQPHGPGVAIGQDGFGAELGGDGLEARGDGVQRIIPGDALEAAFAFGADAALRIEQALGVILALQILRHFAAEKAAGDGVGRIAAQFRAAAVFHRDHERTAIGAIERTHGVTGFGHLRSV